ncbi:MAG: PHP domain-containing protein [Deltaproteobacteria bacterium]|jgi:predicted metal-dependent phosphoesterase TrpH|nr:PHP domain-containing protein [Deltaproteobacteria bacterium]
MFPIDFHCHSTFSDGTLTPTQLVVAARYAGVKGLALTDHDTTEGVKEFLEAGEKYGFKTIGGVELSVNFSGTTHLLALEVGKGKIIDFNLAFLQEYRNDRNLKIFKALEQLGLEISWERILEISGSGQMGKPHFARALMEKGYATNIQEAFFKYLGKGKPAYVQKVRLGLIEALILVLKAGLAPVLAHPITMELEDSHFIKDLALLKEKGLVGLEVYHPKQSLERSKFFLKVARDNDLVVTTGSDYHGANKNTPLTWVRDNCPPNPGTLERLEQGLKNTLERLF